MSAFAEYIEAWKTRDTDILKKAARTRDRLTEKLPLISKILKSLGAKEVIIFGSVANGDFKAGSDVDIAVKGLPEERYIDALILVEKVIAPLGMDFDLVLYERTYPWIKEKIDRGSTI